MDDRCADDRFTVESLRQALGERPFQFVESAGSTMDLARNWALGDPALPGGAVVVAEEQTAGRGRQGRVWVSPPGVSILCSVILRPQVMPVQIPRLVMVGGVAVAETLSAYVPEGLRLKWPNDVLIKRRKVCGILSEASWIGDQLGSVIIGIGINIRVDLTAADLTDRATNVETEAGRAVDRRVILADLLRRVDIWTGRVREPSLVETWRGWLGTLGRRVTIYPKVGGGGEYPAIAESVDENGALIVRLDSGETRQVIAEEVGLWEEE